MCLGSTENSKKLENIISLWYKMMTVLESKNTQSVQNITQFKENTVELNKAVNSLITNPPVPGCKLKYSKQFKSHLLFDYEIQDFSEIWGILGGVDEQNQ